MRPDLGDLIAGIKRALLDEVFPAVGTAYAREQIGYTVALCEHLAARWDRAHLDMYAEHADLWALLATVLAHGRRWPQPSAAVSVLLDRIAAALAHDDRNTPRPLRAVAADSTRFKQLAVELLAACTTQPGDHVDVAAVRQAVLECSERQRRRDQDWVATLPIGWW